MSDVAISVRSVAKRYEVFSNQRSRLLHALFPGYSNGMQEIQALEDVSFEVGRGESVAVIGRNGSGKSTLMQILTGVLTPSEGEVIVKGRVSALLELGSGFNPEYTGRDNVFLNGLLLGLDREEIARRFDEIVAFAEIGDALDRPVKTYSSGMVMRLAFAVQVITDPEILIIDEALSVGDFFFQQKCFGHIRALCGKGMTLVFVSHDMGTVRDLCQRAVYLKQGQARFVGDTLVAVRHYLAETASGADLAAGTAEDVEAAGAGELQAIVRDCLWKAGDARDDGAGGLIAVALYDAQGAPSTSFRLGSEMRVKVAYRPEPNAATHVTAVIRNKFDQIVTSLGSSRLGLVPPSAGADRQVAIFEMRVNLLLEAGNYSVMINLSRLTAPNQGESIDSTGFVGPISVHWDYEREVAPFLGMIGLDAQGAFRRVSADPVRGPS
jgi:lipopolysaccharide transport system ATP-binding protein